MQIVFNPDFSEEALSVAETVRSEYVVEVEGTVTKRDPDTVNSKIKTGQVEVQVSNISPSINQKHHHFLLMKKIKMLMKHPFKIPLFRFKTSRVGTNIQNETSNNTRYS